MHCIALVVIVKINNLDSFPLALVFYPVFSYTTTTQKSKKFMYIIWCHAMATTTIQNRRPHRSALCMSFSRAQRAAHGTLVQIIKQFTHTLAKTEMTRFRRERRYFMMSQLDFVVVVAGFLIKRFRLHHPWKGAFRRGTWLHIYILLHIIYLHCRLWYTIQCLHRKCGIIIIYTGAVLCVCVWLCGSSIHFVNLYVFW